MDEYREILNLTPEEDRREAFYYVVNLLEYVNWYFLYDELAATKEQLLLAAAELELGRHLL